MGRWQGSAVFDVGSSRSTTALPRIAGLRETAQTQTKTKTQKKEKMTALKTQPKIDLSGIDPDHRQWLEQEAHAHKMRVSDLLLAERAGKIDLRPSYHERKDRPDDLAKSLSVTLSVTHPKLRMALKRHAAR